MNISNFFLCFVVIKRTLKLLPVKKLAGQLGQICLHIWNLLTSLWTRAIKCTQFTQISVRRYLVDQNILLYKLKILALVSHFSLAWLLLVGVHFNSSGKG